MNPLHRLGLATARHPWRTITAWILIIIAMGAAASTLGGSLRENWNVPGARAQQGLDLLEEHLPGAGGSSAQVVLHDDAPLDRAVVDATVTLLAALDHVDSVTPRVSADRDTALLYVRYDVRTTDPDIMGKTGPLTEATAPADEAG
jgi:RND superfamily putative drug exporter